ncbi:MAG: SDR family oxidoreductase, partial [Pseudomonadota bacterium]
RSSACPASAVTSVATVCTSTPKSERMASAAGAADILVNNAGGPPPGMWSDWDRDDFIVALDANMLTPIALMKALLPGMMERGWGRVVNITSVSVKAPVPVLGLSNSARAGLTGYVAGTSRQVAGKGVVINNLQPGIHATDRADALDTAVVNAQGVTMDEARAQRAATIPAGRYGTIEEFGAACAFLCSQHAGFIIGQNILLDGGATNSTM